MILKHARFALLFSTLALAACAATPTVEKSGEVPVGDTSQTSLDWQGIYVGTLPCADCEGIETRLHLIEDGTFILTRRYVGKGPDVFKAQGHFVWNEAGSAIRLQGVADGADRYLVGENKLIQLDTNGRRIQGNLADHYQLSKQEVVIDPDLIGRWNLIEVRGKPFQSPPSGESPFIEFHDDGRVSGHAGCNGFFGEFTQSRPLQLNLGKLGSTAKLCQEMGVEPELLELLQRADNYSVVSGRLALNKARMATLLRFESDKKMVVDPALIGRWNLTHIYGEKLNFPSDGSKGKSPYIEFNAEGQVSGNGGCNGFFGGFKQVSSLRLTFEPLGVTAMACPDMNYEAAFLQALTNVDNYTVVDGRLSLNKGRAATALRFDAVSSPATP